jgi:hypothetical protein
MSPYFEMLVSLLKADNWEEPTTKKYHTYIQTYKEKGRNAKAPYFEDIHYAWCLYKPQIKTT